VSPQDARLLDGVANDLTAELRRRLAGRNPDDPDDIGRHVRAAVRDVVEPALTLPPLTATAGPAKQLTLPPPITAPIPEQLVLELQFA
jgi:hypothetical protein